MFSPTLAVLLQLLLLLKATNAQETAETTSVTPTKLRTAVSPKITTTSSPKTSKAAAMTTAAPSAPATDNINSNCAPLAPGALAGIIVVAIIIYVLSLLLTAFLVSHYTKKGTLDLDKLIFNRLPFLKKGRNARDPVNLPQNQDQEAGANEYMETRPSSVYMGLERRDPDHSPTDDSMYTALQDVDRRLPSTNSNEQPAASNNLALPSKEIRQPSPSPTTPKPRGHKQDETEPNKPNTKPKIMKEKPKTKTVSDDAAVYENALSVKR